MNVLIVGYDSDIAKDITKIHRERGDNVKITSRNKAGDYHVELAHSTTWPTFNETYDLVYYCIGLGDTRSTRMEVMQINCFLALDFLSRMTQWVKPGGKIIALTTRWGSITTVSMLDPESAKLSANYKISRAAFNMGVVILSKRFRQFTWVLMHPGTVETKATVNFPKTVMKLSTRESAEGVVKASNEATKPIQFIDWTGQELQF